MMKPRMIGNKMIFVLIEGFIRINIMIVVLFILGTNTPNQIYNIIVGAVGIIWIITPLLRKFLKEKDRNKK